jgi:hypothetical protein
LCDSPLADAEQRQHVIRNQLAYIKAKESGAPEQEI